MEKYTYENWWNGDVTLSLATIYFTKEDKPIVVNWTDFNESDIDRIKEKQAELFAEGVNNLLTTHCEQFNMRYAASEMKSVYLADERQECWNILRGDIPNVEIVILKHWKIGLDSRYLSKVQYYFERTIKDGIDDGLGFVHSPNCKYQDKSLPDSRIYARFVFKYSKWLESFIAKEEIGVPQAQPILSELDLPNQEEVKKPTTQPKNDFPLIFKNGFAYQMFIELKELTVKQTTILADYAFIFHSMKKHEFIHKELKHKTFIDFLNSKFEADISAEKFSFKNQQSKQIVFSLLFDKFKPLIDSVH